MPYFLCWTVNDTFPLLYDHIMRIMWYRPQDEGGFVYQESGKLHIKTSITNSYGSHRPTVRKIDGIGIYQITIRNFEMEMPMRLRKYFIQNYRPSKCRSSQLWLFKTAGLNRKTIWKACCSGKIREKSEESNPLEMSMRLWKYL